ncbi:MAG: hypothetical protein QOF60_2581 [Actinomycetota bacterium]|nr:hypothetical protein [Actinomycetota bacterium]
MSARRRYDTDEEGATLILALVLVTALFLAVGAMTSQLSTQFKVTQIVNDRLDKQYAADGGIDHAVEALRADMRGATRSLCLDAAGGVQTVSTVTVNGHPVDLTCETRQGSTGSGPLVNPASFGLITTSNVASKSLETQGGAPTFTVTGAVYLGGSIVAGNLNKPVTIINGDVGQLASLCTAGSLSADLVTSPPYKPAPACTSLTPVEVAPTVTLPTPVPPTPDALWVKSISSGGTNGCTVYYPGLYASFPDVGNKDDFYLASGVYYFDGGGPIQIANGGTLVGGANGLYNNGDTTTGCATDAQASAHAANPGRITGTGATLILGGDANIVLQGAMTIMARTPLDPSGIPVSIYAVRSTDVAGWSVWSGGATAILDNTTNAGSSLLVHGAVNVFDAPVKLFSSNPTTAVVQGGITAGTVLLKASASASNFSISAFGGGPTSIASRTLRVIAKAKGVNGDPTFTVATAIVSISNTAPYTATVLSWRTDENHS